MTAGCDQRWSPRHSHIKTRATALRMTGADDGFFAAELLTMQEQAEATAEMIGLMAALDKTRRAQHHARVLPFHRLSDRKALYERDDPGEEGRRGATSIHGTARGRDGLLRHRATVVRRLRPCSASTGPSTAHEGDRRRRHGTACATPPARRPRRKARLGKTTGYTTHAATLHASACAWG